LRTGKRGHDKICRNSLCRQRRPGASRLSQYTSVQIRLHTLWEVPHRRSRTEAWQPMGEKAECRERVGDSRVSALDEGSERGDLPVTGRLPRPLARPRNLRPFHPIATQLRRKQLQRIRYRICEKHYLAAWRKRAASCLAMSGALPPARLLMMTLIRTLRSKAFRINSTASSIIFGSSMPSTIAWKGCARA